MQNRNCWEGFQMLHEIFLWWISKPFSRSNYFNKTHLWAICSWSEKEIWKLNLQTAHAQIVKPTEALWCGTTGWINKTERNWEIHKFVGKWFGNDDWLTLRWEQHRFYTGNSEELVFPVTCNTLLQSSCFHKVWKTSAQYATVAINKGGGRGVVFLLQHMMCDCVNREIQAAFKGKS